MSNLFILNEIFTNGMNYGVINIITISSILCGILVIISKNPIVSVLFLIGLFLNIAGYLMMLGMNFIGLSYLLVYVGAVSILFLFILMLINIRISELTDDSSNSIPLAIVIGIFFNMSLYKLLPSNIFTPSMTFIQNKLEVMTTSFAQNDTISSHFYDTAYTLNKSVSLSNDSDLFFVTSQI